MATRRLPPLRALEAFVRTVRLGSARAAADELGLSPSALSRRIGNLEEFVGKKLFTRARQSMKLTEDGHAFFEAVNPQLEALARAVESQSENLSVLRLHLGVLPLFGTQRLFPRLGELRERHPLLHIDIDTACTLSTDLDLYTNTNTATGAHTDVGFVFFLPISGSLLFLTPILRWKPTCGGIPRQN